MWPAQPAGCLHTLHLAASSQSSPQATFLTLTFVYILSSGGLSALQDTFQVGFVVMDTRSGVFDNNGGKDYSLPLAGASTEQEILDRRSAIYEAAERERLAVCPVLSDGSTTSNARPSLHSTNHMICAERTACTICIVCGPQKISLV